MLCLVFLGVFLFFFFRYLYKSVLSLLGLVALVVGGIFNFLTRIFKGCVLDSLNLRVSWVNIADIVIFFGVVLIILGVVMHGKKPV